METAACCRARLAKKEGGHRWWLLPPTSGALGMAKGPNTEISTEAGGGDIHRATFQQDTHCKLSKQKRKTPAAPFLPFLPPNTRPDASHAAGVQKTSLRLLQQGCLKGFAVSQEAKGQLHLTPIPFSYSLSCFLFLIVSHSHPSFPLLFP